MTYQLETQIENLRAEVNRLTNVIAERDTELSIVTADRNGVMQINKHHRETIDSLKTQLTEAERRGEERGWNAAQETINVPMLGDPRAVMRSDKWLTLSDWRNSEEYKK